METNPSPAPQRNRRVGRMSPLPSGQQLNIPPDASQQAASSAPIRASAPAPAPSHGQPPAPVATAQPAPVMQGYPRGSAAPELQQASAPVRPRHAQYPTDPSYSHARMSNPAAASLRPDAATARPASPAAARPTQPPQGYPRSLQQAERPGVPQSPGAAPSRSVYGQPVRPVAQGTARPAGTRTTPAGPRPQAYGQPNRFQSEQPDRNRRYAGDWMQPDAEPSQRSAAAKQRIPSWLWTLFAVMLIGVMLLTACSALMLADLKTKADERQKAWQNTLSNYHVTQQDNGSFRVTWQDDIERYAAMYNLDPAFVTAIIRNESSFCTNATSSVGARGLMQMMPDTAEWIAGKLGEPFDFDRIYEAETSIRYGCWYLNFLSELFQGDTVLVTAAYHAGQGEVLGWLGDRSISPDGVSVPIANIPISNTKTYAGRVTQAYGIYKTLLYSPDPSAAAAVYGADPSVVSPFADR